MNKAILLYYPAKKLLQKAPWACTYDIPIGVCNASMTSRSLASSNELERIFGGVPSSCQARNQTDTSMGRDHFQGSWRFAAVGACLYMYLLSFW